MIKIKAIILAAGKGTRLKPLTDNIPKPLVKINHISILEYILNTLIELNIKEIALIVSYKKQEIIKKITNKYKTANITYIHQEQPLGTGQATLLAKDFTKDSDFISINGDIIYDINILKKIIENSHSNVLALKEITEPRKAAAVTINENLTEDIKELEKIEMEQLMQKQKAYGTIGIYKFSPEIYQAILQTKPSKRNEYEIPDAIKILVKQKKVSYTTNQEYWLGIEDLENLEEAKKWYSNLLKS
ncbi:hypothetical protein CL618_00880 [archaeon]|nr:hypothetical protein [archaeon]|tara:strand:+ start:6642 stop:7376 length:735 start_codon:yes stop_codon:yes gene_type:complete